jgi:type IV secretion system protein TrbJ
MGEETMKRATLQRWKAHRTFYLGLFILVFVFTSNLAHSSGVLVGATEITQLLNNIELVHQTLKQAEQLSAELQMLNNMVQNIKNIPNQIWSTITQDLQAVMRVVQQGQALAFSASNISEEFTRKFPGFVQPTNYIASYKSWSDTTRDSIRGALAAANLQSQQFATEESALSQLRSMSQSAEGRMQALQVGTQVAVEQVAQLQKLRALVMSQMQAQDTYMASQQQQKDSVKAAEDAFYKHRDPRQGKTYQYDFSN